MYNYRIQIDEIRPLRPVWPQPPVDKVKPKDNDARREDDQSRGQPRDDDHDKDGRGVDEFV